MLGSAVGLVLFSSWAEAATYIPVPMVSGAVSQIVFGINDDNIITGSYLDSNSVEHGFFGPLDGSNYTTFDYFQDSTGTEPRAIGADGSISGFAPGGAFVIGEEFFRLPNGFIKTFKIDHQPLDGVAQGISNLDISMGDYYNSSGTRVGYFGVNGRYKKDFNLQISGWLQNSPRAITSDNIVAGYFIDQDGGEHGFIQQRKSVQVIDYPDQGATLTVLEDGQSVAGDYTVSGQWDDSSGNPHAFSLNTTNSSFTPLDPGDGSTYQQAWGMNGRGFIALSTSNGTSFIYCPRSKRKCALGGTEAVTHPIHVAAGTFLHYDSAGRTARKLPPAKTIKTHGAIQ